MNRVAAAGGQGGDDPLADFTSSALDRRRAFRADGVQTRTVSHLLGAITGQRFLEMRVFDITLHAWDLARALGAEERLDLRLVEAVLEILEGSPDGMGFGLTPLGRVAPDAGSQERLDRPGEEQQPS